MFLIPMLLTLISTDSDVIIADRTVLRLHEFLSEQFQARHQEQAGAKHRLLHNPTDQTIERLNVTDEKTHDSTSFRIESWLGSRLFLLDLAYFTYRRFALIDENDGYFVRLLKEIANLVIRRNYRNGAAAPFPLKGKQIRDVVEDVESAYRLSSTTLRIVPTIFNDACGDFFRGYTL